MFYQGSESHIIAGDDQVVLLTPNEFSQSANELTRRVIGARQMKKSPNRARAGIDFLSREGRDINGDSAPIERPSHGYRDTRYAAKD
jgi:hypothetical protein